MTIDGKIATKKGDSELSDKDDWKEVHKLRTQVDAIMVGKGTILKDNPKLHIKYYNHKGYYRIILDSNLTIPLEFNVITFQQEIYPTIICTTDNVPLNKLKKFDVCIDTDCDKLINDISNQKNITIYKRRQELTPPEITINQNATE